MDYNEARHWHNLTVLSNLTISFLSSSLSLGIDFQTVGHSQQQQQQLVLHDRVVCENIPEACSTTIW